MIGDIGENNYFFLKLLVHFENNKKEFESLFQILLKEKYTKNIINNDNLSSDICNNTEFVGVLFAFNSSNELEEISKKNNVIKEKKSNNTGSNQKVNNEGYKNENKDENDEYKNVDGNENKNENKETNNGTTTDISKESNINN